MNLILVLDEAWKYMFSSCVNHCTHIEVSVNRPLLKWARDIEAERVPGLIRMKQVPFVPGICYLCTYTDITFGVKQLFEKF